MIFQKLIFITIFTVSVCTVAMAKDSIPSSSRQSPSKYIVRNLDSIARMWYARDYIEKSEKKTSISDYNSKISDKEINKRIAVLKTGIKIVNNSLVRKYIDYYLKEKRQATEIILTLTDYYVGFFEKEIIKRKLPNELKYLPIAESSLFESGVSESGGTGLWQMKYGNAKFYGLRITSFIDERCEIKKSSAAASDYLSDLYKIYNDWLLAIAAYNTSPSIINKAIRREKGTMDFWSIYKHLPEESRDYVPAFLASVFVMKYYKDYGLQPANLNLIREVDTVIISKMTHFRQISKVLDIPIEKIEFLNRQYKNRIIPENNEEFKLLLPKGSSEKFYALKDSVLKYRDSTIIGYFKLPPSKDKITAEEKVISTSVIYYIVKSNDYLGKIATRYGVKVSEIKRWNNLRSDLIRKGQRLKIYYRIKMD